MQDGLRETIDDISPIEDYTGTSRGRVRRLRVRRPAQARHPASAARRTRRTGAALHDRPLRQQDDGRDPRAARVHGRLPAHDRVGHLHHQRHRARGRHAARALAGRLPARAEGPDQAGLHGQPDAVARLAGSSSRSTRRARSRSVSIASASCRSRRSCARCRSEDPTTGFVLDTTIERGDRRPLPRSRDRRGEPVHPRSRSRRTSPSARTRR